MKSTNGIETTLRHAVAHMGWEELLPTGPRGRVLCLDVGDGQATLALARMYDQVVSVPLQGRDVATIGEAAASAGVHNVTVVPTLREGLGGVFDGLVAVLFGSARGGVAARDAVALVGEAAARIEDGFVLLGAVNVLACDRRPGRGPRGFRTWGARGLERAASASGREHVRSWPVFLSADAPFEVLHGPYRSSSGDGRLVERIKQVLLGVKGAAWFAPGYLTLGQQRHSALVLDELLRDVDVACGGTSRLHRHLTKADKTILVTETSGHERHRVVVLPHTRRAQRRRSREAGILRAARELPPHLRRLFPEFLAKGNLDGQRWLAIERMPGLFVDAAVADLDEITGRAAALLVDLHRETRHQTYVDESVYGASVGALLDSARRRNPWCAELLATIDLQVRAELLGRHLPLVWMHGDYKIENVGIDRDSRLPVGIIDWELAQPGGLPLVDLVYLLVYNRMIREGVAFDAACCEIADGSAWSAGERRLLDEYAATLGLGPDLRTVLRVLFIIHAVGARLHYDAADPAHRERLLRLLTTANETLKPRGRSQAGGAA